jgi:hypothetical protein
MNNEHYDLLGMRGHVCGIRTDAQVIQATVTIDTNLEPGDVQSFIIDLFKHFEAIGLLIHVNDAERQTTRPEPGRCARCRWQDWIELRDGFGCDTCGLVEAPMADHA